MNGRPRKSLAPTHLALPALLAVLVVVVPDLAHAGPLDSASEWIADILYQLVVTVFGTIAGWMGLLLDYAIYMYTIGFGTIYLYSGLGEAIDDIWSIVRDVFNLTFIFGLVYIGIKLILDSEDSSAKRALVMLIGAALLVNFSLFFTKVIVDASHLLTEAIANGFDAEEYDRVSVGAGTVVIKSISAEFVDLMDLGSVYNTDGNQAVNVSSGGKWALIFLTMLLLLIAAFVFAAGAVLLIIRFIAINYYLILSPIMFLGWVFPQLQSFSSNWWRGFLRSAFLAPAYLFLIYIAARTLGSFKDFVTDNADGGLSKAITDSNVVGLYSIIPYFVIIAGFLIGSVVLAQKMGVAGSNTVVKVGHNLRQRGQRALGASTAGVAARAGRNTAGFAAEKAAQSKRLNRWAAKSYAGKQAMKGTRKVADSSFDVRNVGGVGKAIGVGEGRKGGYTSVLKEQEKEEKKFADSLKKADVSKNEANEYNDKEVGKRVQEKKEQLTGELEQTKQEAQNQLQVKQTNFENDVQKDRQKLVELNNELEGATEERAAEINQEMHELNQSLTAREQAFDEEVSGLKETIDVSTARLKNVDQIAESQVEYENQLAYIEQLQRGANFWKSRKTTGATGAAAGAGTLAATAGTLLAAPAVAVAGISGVSAKSKAYENERMVAAMRKEYGTDGVVKKKSSQREKDIQNLAKAVSEQQESSGGSGGSGGGESGQQGNQSE